VDVLPILAGSLLIALLFGLPAAIAYRDLRSGRRDPGLSDGDRP
jgi:hypothetical protein